MLIGGKGFLKWALLDSAFYLYVNVHVTSACGPAEDFPIFFIHLF